MRGLATRSRRRPCAGPPYDAELDAWDTVAVPLAAALNGFKGEANVLNRRRGWTDSLEPALFTNGVDRGTLDAMQEAVVASLPDFAPLPAGQGRGCSATDDGAAVVGPPRAGRRGRGQPGRWTDAIAAVADAFATYSPRAGRAGRPGRAERLDRRRARGPARSAARSACRSRAASRGCC